jgi:hypothetical protein
MYRLMRNIHLILGLVFVLALGVYALSSVRIAHRTWFAGGPTVTEDVFAVDASRAGSPRELALYLIQEQGLVGELFRVQPAEGDRLRFMIRRLGTNYQVEYTRGAEEAQVKTTRQRFIGMMGSMHFAHGFWHDNGLINVWGAVVLLTSIGLFLIGASGIYLWFKTYEERVLGSILLGIGLVFSLTLMVLVRIQG